MAEDEKQVGDTDGSSGLQVTGSGSLGPFGKYNVGATGQYAVASLLAIGMFFSVGDAEKTSGGQLFRALAFAFACGIFLGTALAKRVADEKERRIADKGREIERMAAHNKRLENRLLPERSTSAEVGASANDGQKRRIS